jgi:hypothetical protein
MWTVLYWTLFSRTQFGVSINIWRLGGGDTLNITCNFLYYNHQVHTDFMITLYLYIIFFWSELFIVWYRWQAHITNCIKIFLLLTSHPNPSVTTTLFFPLRVIAYNWNHPIHFTLPWPVFSSSYSTLLQKLKIIYNTTMKITNKTHYGILIIPSRLYMFQAMFLPIIRSTWMYLQYLVKFSQVAAGWCPEWVQTKFQLINLLFQVGFTCFRRCFLPSSGAPDCIYSIR